MRGASAPAESPGMGVVPLLVATVFAAPAPVQLGAADRRRTVRLAPATPVVLTLVSNPSTGFAWKLLTPLDKRVAKLVSHRYVAPASKLIGAAGREVWRFRALARGTTTLRLVYVRSWAPNDIEGSFTAVFRVRP
jgi:inhibitor of cysteine peptidase